jgi:hypothetical protein
VHSKTLIIITAAIAFAAVQQSASASPLIAGGALPTATENISPVEPIHYYGYRGYGGYYGRGYYGGGGYYGGYGRGYYGGYGRGYYGGYGRGYYGGYRYY